MSVFRIRPVCGLVAAFAIGLAAPAAAQTNLNDMLSGGGDAGVGAGVGPGSGAGGAISADSLPQTRGEAVLATPSGGFESGPKWYKGNQVGVNTVTSFNIPDLFKQGQRLAIFIDDVRWRSDGGKEITAPNPGGPDAGKGFFVPGAPAYVILVTQPEWDSVYLMQSSDPDKPDVIELQTTGRIQILVNDGGEKKGFEPWLDNVGAFDFWFRPIQ